MSISALDEIDRGLIMKAIDAAVVTGSDVAQRAGIDCPHCQRKNAIAFAIQALLIKLDAPDAIQVAGNSIGAKIGNVCPATSFPTETILLVEAFLKGTAAKAMAEPLDASTPEGVGH